MQLVYSGAHPEVVVDELDSGQVIKAGEPVEIPDDLAARLLMQDTWSKAEAPADRTFIIEPPASSDAAPSEAPAAHDDNTKADS